MSGVIIALDFPHRNLTRIDYFRDPPFSFRGVTGMFYEWLNLVKGLIDAGGMIERIVGWKDER